MSTQTIMHIRIDKDLKDQALIVLDDMGMDIPTAFRMFLKATIREGRIPFDIKTSINQPESYSDKLAQCVKSKMIYEPLPSDNENVVVLMPLDFSGAVSPHMYVQLLRKIPRGMITRWEDMNDYISKIYNLKSIPRVSDTFPYIDSNNNDLPYWKIVSQTGVLFSSTLCDKDKQKEMLKKEGIEIVQRGSKEDSYKVKDYKSLLFDFGRLTVFK